MLIKVKEPTRPLFRCFEFVGERLKLIPAIEIQLERHSQLVRRAETAQFLIDAATELFCGYLPSHSPYVPDESFGLSWADEYFVQLPNSERLYRDLDVDELKGFANVLRVEDEDGAPQFAATITAWGPNHSGRFIVQGLAVEILVDLDRYFAALIENRFLDAINWFEVANSNLMEAFAEARNFIVPMLPESIDH